MNKNIQSQLNKDTKKTGKKTKLGKNQSLVLFELINSNEPLSAYSLLDSLREHGIKSPLQIYRALNNLIILGHVHKLESQNSFIACSHHGCGVDKIIAFIICSNCNKVNEISDDGLTRKIKSLAKKSDLKLVSANVELRGICNDCQRE